MTNCEMLTALWLEDMKARAKAGDWKAREVLRAIEQRRHKIYYG